MALRSDIFQRNSLSGTTSVRNGFANVVVDVGPYGLTGNINFIVQLRRGSIAGEVIAATPPINLVDYSELISFAPNVAIISEGEDVRFDLLTANVPDGSTFYYTANAVSGNVDAEDFISEITGSVIIYDNQANILISSNSVPTTAVETGEVFDIQLRLGSISGEVTKTSNVVEILDTANVVDVAALSLSSNVIFESESVVFTIDTVNALGTNSQTLYYTVTGNADIYSGQSGSFLISGNQANLEIIADASVNREEVRTFAVEIRRGSISGPVLQTSDTIYVQDAIVGIVATGGNVTTSGDYTTHSFNTSSSLNITRSGEANILVVGGGGGGGSSNPTGWQSGGGGAGGLIHATDYRLPADTYTITIGAGGGGDQNGANTTFISPVIELISLGGGRGGNGGFGGYPGGSGGGGAHNNGGFGSALQANSFGDSGLYGYGNPGAGGGPGTGGGGGGAGTAGIGGNGPGGNGLPVVMLTEGQNDYYAGGGGGGGAAGGLGGGGQGPGPAGAGTVNSGGGGGSSGYNPGNPGGPGGSGVVLVKYKTSSVFTPKISLVTDVSTDALRYYADDTATIRVRTANVVSDEIMYYNILGISNAEIIGGNTGSLTVTSNNNVEFPITFNLAPLDQANAVIQIRRNSNDGALLGISDAIPIVPREVLGGTLLDEGTDFVHIFLTTSNISISSTGAGIEANVLMVAGGGSSQGGYAGGGGAGGMLEIPVTLSEGEYTMIVGGGGSGTNGSNTSAFGTTVVGGGKGAYTNIPGQLGGSGGGGGGNPNVGVPAGAGIAGQGNPGSAPPPSLLGGNGYSGAGGGAGGAGGGGPSFTGGAGRISTLSPLDYGTNPSNSPTPGGSRYFAGGGSGSNGSIPSAVGGTGGGGNSKANGQTNTGGGGGGNPWRDPVLTSGGSGIIMVRYPKP